MIFVVIFVGVVSTTFTEEEQQMMLYGYVAMVTLLVYYIQRLVIREYTIQQHLDFQVVGLTIMAIYKERTVNTDQKRVNQASGN